MNWLTKILSIVFITSGVLKSVNVYSFAQEIILYSSAYIPFFSLEWSVLEAVIICSLETFLGISILDIRCVKFASWMIAGLMSLFLYLTSANYFFPSEAIGSIESCGCFGEIIHLTPYASFLKSLILWILAISVLLNNRFSSQNDTGGIDGYISVYATVSTALPLFSLFYVNLLNPLIYIVTYIALSILFASILLLLHYKKQQS